jgi:hypothetical protein
MQALRSPYGLPAPLPPVGRAASRRHPPSLTVVSPFLTSPSYGPVHALLPASSRRCLLACFVVWSRSVHFRRHLWCADGPTRRFTACSPTWFRPMQVVLQSCRRDLHAACGHQLCDLVQPVSLRLHPRILDSSNRTAFCLVTSKSISSGSSANDAFNRSMSSLRYPISRSWHRCSREHPHLRTLRFTAASLFRTPRRSPKYRQPVHLVWTGNLLSCGLIVYTLFAIYLWRRDVYMKAAGQDKGGSLPKV